MATKFIRTASAATTASIGVRRLPQEIVDLLLECEVDGSLVKLVRRISNDQYRRLKRSMVGLGGSWNTRLQAFWFHGDAGPILAAATGDGYYVDPVQRYGQFDTPDDLADRLVAASAVQDGDRVLEPSAGTGSLIRAVLRRAAPASVTVYEIDEARCAVLRNLLLVEAPPAFPHTSFTLQPVDALAWIQLGTENGCMPGPFDVVTMNPPHARGADIAHIRACWPLLKPGGRLAAICSEAGFHQQNATAAGFRNWLMDIGAEVTPLPDGSFKGAGTDAKTRMIVATKGHRL